MGLFIAEKQAKSISIDVTVGVYILITYVFGFSIPTLTPTIMLIGDSDFHDVEGHSTMFTLHEHEKIKITISLLKNDLHQMRVTLEYDKVDWIRLTLLRMCKRDEFDSLP